MTENNECVSDAVGSYVIGKAPYNPLADGQTYEFNRPLDVAQTFQVGFISWPSVLFDLFKAFD